MVASTQVLEVPYHAKIADENGEVTRPWIDFFSFITDSVRDLETSVAVLQTTATGLESSMTALQSAATNMESLAFGTDGFATSTDTATAWESLRADLLVI